jgi:radical SAM protein with 4Fe4S-binding SPASM domain
VFTKTPDKFINKLQLTRAYNNKNCRFSEYPPVINIEVSSRCNLHCPICGRFGDFKRQTGDMSLATYEKLVRETRKFAELYVLHNEGEPLLNKNLPAMVQGAHKEGIATMFSTNAALLDERLSLELISSGLDMIIFAVDGARKETFEKIRVGADFDKVVENIKGFISCRRRLKKKSPFIIVQLIEMHDNRSEIAEFKKFWSNFPVQCFIKPCTEWHKKLRIGHSDICDRLWYQAVVLHNGEVIPCCQDINMEHSLGNINDGNFIEIWNGPKMEAIRDSNINARNGSGLCKKCNYESPRRRTKASDAAQCLLDFGTLARILYKLGYQRKSQR